MLQIALINERDKNSKVLEYIQNNSKLITEEIDGIQYMVNSHELRKILGGKDEI